MLLCTIFQGDTDYNGQTYKSNIGYFVLEAFDDMAFSEVKQAIDFLAENQIDDLILDLRFSPGGSLITGGGWPDCSACPPLFFPQ